MDDLPYDLGFQFLGDRDDGCHLGASADDHRHGLGSTDYDTCVDGLHRVTDAFYGLERLMCQTSD